MSSFQHTEPATVVDASNPVILSFDGPKSPVMNGDCSLLAAHSGGESQSSPSDFVVIRNPLNGFRKVETKGG